MGQASRAPIVGGITGRNARGSHGSQQRCTASSEPTRHEVSGDKIWASRMSGVRNRGQKLSGVTGAGGVDGNGGFGYEGMNVFGISKRISSPGFASGLALLHRLPAAIPLS